MPGRRKVRRTASRKSSAPYIALIAAVAALVLVVIVLTHSGDTGDGGETEKPTGPGSPETSSNEPGLDEGDQPRAELERKIVSCTTAKDFLEAARLARKMGIEEKAQLLFHKALSLDPQNSEANKALGHRKFNPARELAGFNRYDEHRFLTESLSPFSRLAGRWLTEEKISAVAVDWKKLVPELDRLVAENSSDPFLVKINQYRTLMLSRPFYGEIGRSGDYTLNKNGRPFALFIQHDRAGRKSYANEIEATYARALSDLNRFFEKEFAAWLGLKRRPGFDALIVWVLNSHGEYENQANRLRRTYLSPMQFAHYNLNTREAITYWDEESGFRKVMRHCVLHESVHYLCDAYAPGGIRGMSSLWVVEGLAEYLGTATKPSPTAAFQFREKNRNRRAEFLDGIAGMGGNWPLTIEEVVGARNARHLSSIIDQAGRADKIVGAVPPQILVSWFYSASYSLCRYLGEKHPERFKEYLTEDLNGRGGPDVFARIFEIESPGDFEMQIVEHATGRKIEKRPIERRAGVLTLEAPGEEAGEPVAAGPLERLDLDDMIVLVKENPDPDSARALVKHCFFTRGPDAAASLLDRILSLEGLDGLRGSLLEDARIVADLKSFLLDIFGSMAEKKTSCPILEGNERFIIESYRSPDLITLDSNNVKRVIPFSNVSMDRFAWMVKINLNRKGDPHARRMLGHLFLLSGRKSDADKEYRRAGGESIPGAEYLGSYEKAASEARLLDIIDRAACDRALPTLEEVRTVLSEEAGSTMLDALKPSLKKAAACVIAREAPEDLLQDSFNGRCRIDGESGWFRIEYPRFEAAHLEDWQNWAPDCVKFYREAYRSGNPTFPDTGSSTVKKGVLKLLGDQVLTSKVEYAGDVALTFEARYPGDSIPVLYVGIGQVDGKGAILSNSMQSLEIKNYANPRVVPDEYEQSDFQIFLNEKYKYRIERNGSRITCTINGQPTAAMTYSGLERGRIFIWSVNKTPFEISSLTIEGAVEPAWMEKAAQQALNEKVRALFRDL